MTDPGEMADAYERRTIDEMAVLLESGESIPDRLREPLRRLAAAVFVHDDEFAGKQAGRYLNKVADGIKPGVKHPLPEPIYEPFHRCVTYPATDNVILDERSRVLLVNRDDRYFKGLELVGGYSHTCDGTPQNWCNRLAQRDIGTEVQFEGFVGVHMWPPGEHPHGFPISLVTICRLVGEPTKNIDKIGFFDEVPEGMVPNHGKFIRVAREAIRTGKIIPAI